MSISTGNTHESDKSVKYQEATVVYSPAITFVFLMLPVVDFLSLWSDCEYLCVGQHQSMGPVVSVHDPSVDDNFKQTVITKKATIGSRYMQ